MRKNITLILFMLFSYSLSSQILKQKSNFPETWLGTYNGEMFISKAGSSNIDTIHVQFEFLKTDKPKSWIYRMTYDNAKYGKIIKDYLLIKSDSLAESTYILDEKDGIRIENALMGNTLYSCFSVSGYRLFSFLRKENDELSFEIITTKDIPTSSTKNKAKEAENIFEVNSYLPFTTQFVRFLKVKN